VNLLTLALLILLFPFLAFWVNLLLGKRLPRQGDWVSVLAVFASFLVSLPIFFHALGLYDPGWFDNPGLVWFRLGGFEMKVGVLANNLMAIMLTAVLFVTFLIHVYSIGYMHGDARYSRYFAYLSLFTFSISGIVLSDNLFTLYIFWELVGVCSYFLIGFWFEKKSASDAAVKAFIVNRVGDAGFLVGIAIVSGLWLVPWLAARIGGGGRSRELFLLLVLLLCFGAAVGTHLIGLSIVFGAFLIGLVMRQSRFGHEALTEIGPLRDVFATLFFLSLGMLLDPRFVRDHWSSVASMLVFIICIKLLVVFGVVRFYGHSRRTAFLAGAGLFQIGEFGFILAQGGMDMGFISQRFYSSILASAVITMLLTPLLMNLIPWLHSRLISAPTGRVSIRDIAPLPSYRSPEAPKRVVIAGYGRIGQSIAQGLEDAGIPYIVIDIDPGRVSEARSSGHPRIYGDASNAHVLSQAGLDKARALVITFSDPTAVIGTTEAALHINPRLDIVARVDRARDARLLRTMGVIQLVNPEYEASLEFLRRILTKSVDE